MHDGMKAGDFLVFQLEAGFSLLRLIAIDDADEYGRVFHVAGYREFFPDVESAENAIDAEALAIESEHIALTERAFDSTQVATIANRTLESDLLAALDAWRNSAEREVSDRSVRLMLGFR